MIAQNFLKKQFSPEISSLPEHRLPGTAVILKQPAGDRAAFELFDPVSGSGNFADWIKPLRIMFKKGRAFRL